MTIIKKLLIGASLTCAVANVTHAATSQEMIDKGKYLTAAADCVACHITPGGKPYAGGLEFKLPFGSLYSPNITPDKETGIGTWTDEEFVSALQEGVGKDGKHYYPAFPYTSYTKMSRDEILAIKAYLFSLEPVSQRPPENDISFPFNQRWGMMFWNFVFLDEERYTNNPDKSDTWNRGAYLVEGPGHCGECHTPRNLFQATKDSKALAGTNIQGWKAYNISSDPKQGIGAWSEDDLVNYFSQGAAPGYGVASGPMADVVEHSLSQMTQEDLNAIAVYLKDTQPQTEGVSKPPIFIVKAAESSDSLGKKVFADACSSCHLWTGQGRQTPVTTLSGLKTVNDPEGTNLINILLTGNSPIHISVDHRMPSFKEGYSDEELAAVSSFVLKHFGTTDASINQQQIKAAKEAQSKAH